MHNIHPYFAGLSSFHHFMNWQKAGIFTNERLKRIRFVPKGLVLNLCELECYSRTSEKSLNFCEYAIDLIFDDLS